jgi:hypothetical protein
MWAAGATHDRHWHARARLGDSEQPKLECRRLRGGAHFSLEAARGGIRNRLKGRSDVRPRPIYAQREEGAAPVAHLDPRDPLVSPECPPEQWNGLERLLRPRHGQIDAEADQPVVERLQLDRVEADVGRRIP